VARLASIHRVEGLVANGIAELGGPVPPAVADLFAETRRRVRSQALQDVAETLRVADAMERAGIAYCVLKGAPLGARAYASPLIKQSWDIDLLVTGGDVPRAAKTLYELGYGPYGPPRPLTESEFRRWSVVSKEAELRSAKRSIELHWGLADHPLFLVGLGIDQATCRTELFGGRWVPTFEDSANLAYLAVHGASHGWSRLKWLADFNALLAALPEEGRALALAEAERWGTGLALQQAVEMTRLLGSRPSPTTQDPAVHELVRLARVAIERRGLSTDFDSDPIASRALGGIRRGLMRGTRYRLRLALIVLRGSEDRREIPLPGWLRWTYWPMRPFSILWRVTARHLRKAR
jgi:hypothetical protein